VIPWALGTVNFIYGCQRVSEGCDNCYIDRRPWNLQLERFEMRTPFEGRVRFFDESKQIRKLQAFPENSLIWTNGLGDTFAEFVDDTKRDRWQRIFESFPQYQFVICTKRPGLMMNYYKTRKVPSNVWVGTTVENKRYSPRIDLLKSISAKVKWISFEPLLEDLGEMDLQGIQWAAVGGETEPSGRFRRFNQEWAWHLKQTCERDSVRFWYEGGNGFSDGARNDLGMLHGETFRELPEFEQVRQTTLP